MICYRFKHLPTGMYWRPSSEVQVRDLNPDGTTRLYMYVKTNLSRKGKVYPQKPSWSWISGGYYNHLLVKQEIIDQKLDHNSAYRLKHKTYPFIEADWVLEEVQ